MDSHHKVSRLQKNVGLLKFEVNITSVWPQYPGAWSGAHHVSTNLNNQPLTQRIMLIEMY